MPRPIAGLRVLGLDPGSLRTGYGVVQAAAQGGKPSLVAAGAIQAPAKAELPQRLAAIFQELGALMDRYQPQEMAVEGVFTARNARSALVLGQARGVALLAGANHGLAIFEYPPATVKKALVGTGRASKDQVRTMVAALLGGGQALAGELSEDASDACALAVCHLHSRALRARGLK